MSHMPSPIAEYLSAEALKAAISRQSFTIEHLERQGHNCPDAKREFDKLLQQLIALNSHNKT